MQILVYAGTVSILMLLGLMLTRGAQQNLPERRRRRRSGPSACGGAGVLAVALITAVLDSDWPRDTGR